MKESKPQLSIEKFVEREVIYSVSNLIWHLLSEDAERENLFDQFPHFFESLDDEGEPIEIYEHWIVTDWFVDKLIEHGESVEKDFFGLSIWGRTTTGQAIYLDSVIEDIYHDLYKS